MTTSVVLPDAPGAIAGRRLFAVRDIEFTIADVAPRARLGDRELAAFPGSSPAVQEAFRRRRGLLTADQLLGWLDDWSITPDEFQAWSETPAVPGTWTALVCSGAFDRAASEVAAAAAAACELGAAPTGAAWFDPAGWTDRLAARALTPEALSAATRTHRLGWTRLSGVGVLARSRAVAEELRHWVRVDGLDLEIAATQAGCPSFGLDAVLDEVHPSSLRARLAGTQAGELVGPVGTGPTDTGAGWVVLRLDDRREPDPDDPATSARARAAVSAQAVERAVLRHVSA